MGSLMARPRKGPTQRAIGVAVYFPPSVKKRLQAVADADRRTLSNLVVILVDEALKARGAR